MEEIILRVERMFKNGRFVKELQKSRKNWLDIEIEEVLEKEIIFLKSLV